VPTTGASSVGGKVLFSPMQWWRMRSGGGI
jgi:hypothetical protein